MVNYLSNICHFSLRNEKSKIQTESCFSIMAVEAHQYESVIA